MYSSSTQIIIVLQAVLLFSLSNWHILYSYVVLTDSRFTRDIFSRLDHGEIFLRDVKEGDLFLTSLKMDGLSAAAAAAAAAGGSGGGLVRQIALYMAM